MSTSHLVETDESRIREVLDLFDDPDRLGDDLRLVVLEAIDIGERGTAGDHTESGVVFTILGVLASHLPDRSPMGETA